MAPSCPGSGVQRSHMAWKALHRSSGPFTSPSLLFSSPDRLCSQGLNCLLGPRFAVSSSTVSHVSLQGPIVVARLHRSSVQDVGQGSALHSGVLCDLSCGALPSNHPQDHKDSLQVYSHQRQRGSYHSLLGHPL